MCELPFLIWECRAFQHSRLEVVVTPQPLSPRIISNDGPVRKISHTFQISQPCV